MLACKEYKEENENNDSALIYFVFVLLIEKFNESKVYLKLYIDY